MITMCDISGIAGKYHKNSTPEFYFETGYFANQFYFGNAVCGIIKGYSITEANRWSETCRWGVTPIIKQIELLKLKGFI